MTTKLPIQRGPKPNGWITLELDGHLLVGERFGRGDKTEWRFECDTMPELAESKRLKRTIAKFLEAVNRGKANV